MYMIFNWCKLFKNVFNDVNLQDLVLGYFVVSDVHEERVMLPRNNIKGGAINGLFNVLNV